MYVSLRSGTRIRSVYRDGSRHRIGGVVVYRSTGAIAAAEATFVATKSVGNAVARNRAKRRMREAARRVALEPASAYVFVATRSVLDVRFDTLVDWMSLGAAKQHDTRTSRETIDE